jgi:hypothetical protein
MLSRRAEVRRLQAPAEVSEAKQFARHTFERHANLHEHFVKVFNSSVENRVEKGRP